MKKVRVFFAVLVLMAGLLASCAFAQPTAQSGPVVKPFAQEFLVDDSGNMASIKMPLPGGIKIIPPSADIPEDIAAFSGIWQGMWNNILPTALVVEEIRPPDVVGVYVMGSSKIVFGKFEGVVKSGKLEFTNPNGEATYLLQNGELKATFKVLSLDGKKEKGILRGTMRRRQE